MISSAIENRGIILDQNIKIGNYEISLPLEHKLPVYLNEFPEYDFRYWRTIGSLCTENGWKDIALFDIGANVGDSAAHFRGFSKGTIWAFEPSMHYYKYLEKNTQNWSDINLSNAMITTPTIKNKIELETYHGTGRTIRTDDAKYDGDTILTTSLLKEAPDEFIIKSDTDGFDGHLVHSLGVAMKKMDKFAKVVTFEGPSRPQGQTRDIQSYSMAIKTLQSSGYLVQILSNLGAPIAYVGADFDAFKWQINSWMLKLENNDFTCPYFDFICVHKDASTKTFNFVTPS